MIKPEGDEWVLYSQDGEKVLGRFATKEKAEEREAEIERIEHAKAEGSEGPRWIITLGEVGAGLVRIPLAMIGKWVKGPLKFAIKAADLSEVVRNFRKRQADLVVDYEHASEHPEVAAGGPVPAAGWLKQVEDAPDERGVLWGLAEFTAQARELIAQKAYRYLSPAIGWAVRDKQTGEQQGCTLMSMALTNRPFLEALPALALSEGWDEDKEESAMAEDKKQEKKEEGGAGTSANEPKVIRLSDVKRGADGRFDFAGIEAKGDVLIAPEVLRAERGQALLDEAIKAGKILPAQRKYYEALALSDTGGFGELMASMKPQIDLSERGISGGGGEGGKSELKQIDQRMRAEIEKKRAADAKVTEAEALVLVASEHPDWAERRRTLLLAESAEK